MNRTNLRLALLLLAIGAISCQTAGTACPTDSRFLNMLKKKNSAVVLTTSKASTSNTCKEAWSTSGTCCDVDILTNSFDDIMKGIKKGFDDFIEGLKPIGKATDQIQKLANNKDELKTKIDGMLTTMASSTTTTTATGTAAAGTLPPPPTGTSAPPPPTTTTSGTATTAAGTGTTAAGTGTTAAGTGTTAAGTGTTAAGTGTAAGTTKPAPPAMNADQCAGTLAYISTYKDDAKKFMEVGKGCFEALKDASGKTICHGCSAAPPTGTSNSDGTISITQASCSALLDKCFHTWQFMFKMGSMLECLAIFARGANPDAPQPKTQPQPNFGGISINDLITAFTNCQVSPTESTCTEDNKAVLCKAHFNVMAPPKRASFSKENDAVQVMEKLPPPKTETGSVAATPPTGPPRTSTGSGPTAGSTTGTAAGSTTGTATTQPPKRVLQSGAASSSSGDITIGANGVDFTKPMTVPLSSATVESSNIDAGLSNAYLSLGSLIAFLSAMSMLN